jgi:hypothetical protein
MLTEPILILVSALSAISWGIIYLFSESLTRVYMSMGFSATQASLPFIAIGLGILLSILPRFHDLHILSKKQKAHIPISPEDKMTGFALAAPALAAGLWWFSWTVPPYAPAGLSWVVSTAGLVLIGFAVNEMAYTLSGYLADTYTVYAASAFAGLAFIRALVSGVMPLIAYVMYRDLSANVAGSILAGIATLFAAVAPVVFFGYGRRLRLGSEFAKYSFEVNQQTQIEELDL